MSALSRHESKGWALRFKTVLRSALMGSAVWLCLRYGILGNTWNY